MNERIFKIPEFEYFEMGGKYSGCKRGAQQQDFNFRLTPGEKILAQVWYGVYCFDKSELVSESEFDKSRDGYRAACDWVEEQFKVWSENHEKLPPGRGSFSNPPAEGTWNSFLEDVEEE
ncbi:MAG: hypothetical protein NC253_05840 [Ruminococcus sp.]|nr:hypothetical protein [Ruminococcus sp.]MCM1382472.1 hypothetical protein [Muribaculaceae bacterium]MCM1479748.1 hypothetical protein [Muribaculaceae bacterium]